MKTSCTPTASVLLTKGFTLNDYERSGNRTKFCFEIDEDESIYDVVDGYNKRKLVCEPMALIQNFRHLTRMARNQNSQ